MSWNIHIIDDFLPKDIFNNIYENIGKLSFSPMYIKNNKGEDKDAHIFFSHAIHSDDNFITTIKENVRKKFRQEMKRINLAAWTLTNAQEPAPHFDIEKFPGERHLMIYIKGDQEVNSGTGFYIENKDKGHDLNTHIGFKKNRAVLFSAKNCMHSPLLWNSTSMGRYACLVWFESVDYHD